TVRPSRHLAVVNPHLAGSRVEILKMHADSSRTARTDGRGPSPFALTGGQPHTAQDAPSQGSILAHSRHAEPSGARDLALLQWVEHGHGNHREVHPAGSSRHRTLRYAQYSRRGGWLSPSGGARKHSRQTGDKTGETQGTKLHAWTNYKVYCKGMRPALLTLV